MSAMTLKSNVEGGRESAFSMYPPPLRAGCLGQAVWLQALQQQAISARIPSGQKRSSGAAKATLDELGPEIISRKNK
jgi:hypothetical protein